MKLLRSVAGIAVGYLIFAVSAVLLFNLTGVAPHAPQPVAIMLGATLYGMVFSAIGGALGVRIAGYAPARHGLALAALIAAGATASMLTSPDADATWSQWSAILFMAPSAWAGARGRGRA